MNDIGARIGLDGAADFRRELKLITQQSKELDSEMKALTSSFDANDRSQAALKAQSEVLGRQIDTQKKKIDLLSSQYGKANTELGRLAAELQDATQAYGANSKEADNALKAYQKQSETVSKLKTNLNNATTALNKMEKQQSDLSSELNDSRSAYDKLNDAVSDNQNELNRLKRAYSDLVLEQKESTDEAEDLKHEINRLSTELSQNRSALKQAADAADELDRSLDDVDDSASNASSGISSFGDIVSGNVIADGISDIISGIKDLHDSSIEYRTIMASLETSSERAGYSARQTEEAYDKLIGVLGDTQTAATTTANLQAIGYAQEDLQDIIDGTIGAWASYGDSIPIDSLAESINETISAREVTGTFADVLNWAKVSEDDFNEMLLETNDSTEAQNLVLKQLSKQGLVEAGEAWQEANQSLMEYNQSQDDLDAALADLSETLEPALTAATQFATEFIKVNTHTTELDKALTDVCTRYDELSEKQKQQVQNLVEEQGYQWGTTEAFKVQAQAIADVTGESNALAEAQTNNNAVSEQTNIKLGEQLVAFQNLDEGTQQSVINITTAMTNMRDSVTSAVQSQMDIFAEFQQASAVETETILSNMQSQVDGFNNWGQNLADLANSTKTTTDGMQVTINKGLLQHLANMGPEGAGYVEAFKNMTGDELAQANSLWEQSVDIQGMTTDWGEELMTGVGTIAAGGQEAFAQLSSDLNFSANKAGVYTGQGFIEGVESIVSQAADSTEALGDDSIEALRTALGTHSPSWKTRDMGKDVDQGLINGLKGQQSQIKTQSQNLGKSVTDSMSQAIKSGQSKVTSAVRSMATQIKSISSSTLSYSAFYSIGVNVSNGMAAGIRAGSSAAISAAASMASNALAAAKSRLDIHSPSKEFENIGIMSDEGFAEGLENGEAIKQMQKMINAMIAQAQLLAAMQLNTSPIEIVKSMANGGNTEIQIVVNAAQGQSEEQIANIVMYKIQHAVNQKKAVW